MTREEIFDHFDRMSDCAKAMGCSAPHLSRALQNGKLSKRLERSFQEACEKARAISGPQLLIRQVRTDRQNSCRGTIPTERELKMRAMLDDSATLDQIGSAFNLTRERVRQLLKKFFGNVVSERVAKRKAEHVLLDARKVLDNRAARRNKVSDFYKCSLAEWSVIVGAKITNFRRCRIALAFKFQKSNAAGRGIAFEMSLPEWYSAWLASGKWAERGRGYGYCMARIGDTGAYAIGNIYFTTGAQNAADQYVSGKVRKGRQVNYPNAGKKQYGEIILPA